MGKRQIGEMQPFEFVITLLIAELACIPMSDVSVPLSYGLISVLAVFILHQIMSLVEGSGKFAKFLISGKPSVVITPDGISICELKKNNMDAVDLAETMRAQGYFAFDDVVYGIFESNGKLSVLENKKKEDEKCNTHKDDLPALSFILISGGKEIKSNMKSFDMNFEKIKEKLKMPLLKIKNIEVLTLDRNNRIYLKLKNEKYRIVYI